MNRQNPKPPSGSSAGQTLAPLVIGPATVRFRDQQDLMAQPFFSLAKARRVQPIHYASGQVEICVRGLPEYGLATIWDADVLIWAISRIAEARNRGFATTPRLQFTPYQLLGEVGRGHGARGYQLLKQALRRLQSTVVVTTIRQGEHWRRRQFSWICEWRELTNRDGRVEGMELVLPDWLYQGVLDPALVLGIDPAYFRLSGGVERWLYRVARKHAGRQPDGWAFEVAHLHAKSGSLSRPTDFAIDVRKLVARQSLPDYRLILRRTARGELLHIVPLVSVLELPASPVRQPVDQAVDRHGTSGAGRIGTSSAEPSVLRAQNPLTSPCPEKEIRPLNLESNLDSNFQTRAPARGPRR